MTDLIEEPRRRGRPPRAFSPAPEESQSLVDLPEAEAPDPRFAAAPEEEPPAAEPEPTTRRRRKSELPDGWLAMDGDTPPPQDGKPLWLLGNVDDVFITAEAVWRNTRRWAQNRWDTVGFWAKRNAGGEKIGFEPMAWRPVSG